MKILTMELENCEECPYYVEFLLVSSPICGITREELNLNNSNFGTQCPVPDLKDDEDLEK